MIFKSKISGIPCAIQVTKVDVESKRAVFSPGHKESYIKKSGNHEFVVLDRRGYVAKWLARKITPDEYFSIIEQIDRELGV